MKTRTSREMRQVWLAAGVLLVLLLAAAPVGAAKPNPAAGEVGIANWRAPAASALAARGTTTWSDAGAWRYSDALRAKATGAPKAKAAGRQTALREMPRL